MKRRTVGVLSVLAVLVVSCGDDDDASSPPTTGSPAATTAVTAAPDTAASSTAVATDPTTTQEAATTSSTATSSTTTSTTESSVEEPAVDFDPQAVILTVDDLPPGWSQEPDEEDESDDDEESSDCLDTALDAGGLERIERDERLAARAAFSESELGPFLLAGVGGGFDQGPEMIAALPDLFAACDLTTDSEGNTLHVGTADFPQIGDGTFAVHVFLEAEFPITTTLVFAYDDDVLLFVALVAIGDASDEALLESALRTMANRL